MALEESSQNSYTGKREDSSFKALVIDSESDLQDDVKILMKKSLQNYLKHLDVLGLYNTNLSKHLNYAHSFRILKYENNAKIHPHSDHELMTYASVVLNLTGDYKGGDFCFFNKKHNVQLGQGDLMVFPATDFFIHEVTPVTKGERYSINSFIKSVPAPVNKILRNQVIPLVTEYHKNTNPKHINGPFF